MFCGVIVDDHMYFLETLVCGWVRRGKKFV